MSSSTSQTPPLYSDSLRGVTSVVAGANVTVATQPLTGVVTVSANAGPPPALSDLTDVDVAVPATADLALHYDATAAKWKQVSELSVNSATREVDIVTSGGFGAVADGAALLQSNASTADVVGQTTTRLVSTGADAQVVGQTDVTLTSSTAGNVDISTSDGAAAYAGRIAARDAAVPNVKYVNDAVGAIDEPAGVPYLNTLDFRIPDARALGAQGSSINGGEYLARDVAFNDTSPAVGQWYGGIYVLNSAVGSKGINPDVVANGSIGTQKGVLRMLTQPAAASGTLVRYLLFEVLDYNAAVGSVLLFNNQWYVNNGLGQPPTRVRISAFGDYDVDADVGSNPLPNTLLWLTIGDTDRFERQAFDFDSVLSWAVSNPAVSIFPDASTREIVTTSTVDDVVGTYYTLSTRDANAIEFTFQSLPGAPTARSAFFVFNPTGSWYANQFLVRARVSNAQSAFSDLAYTVQTLDGISFLKYAGAVGTPVTTWTQQDIEDGLIFGVITSGRQSVSFELALQDTRLSQPPAPVFEPVTLAVPGAYINTNTSTTAEVAARLEDYARRDGADVGSVVLGSTQPTTGVQIDAAAGTAFSADPSGTVSITANGASNSVTLQSGTGTGKIFLEPAADATSYAEVSTTNKSATQYATDVAGVPSAVPNVQHVTDAISTKAAKDGTDTGAVILGSSDSTTSVIANAASPGGLILQCDGSGATSVASQNANLSLLTQSTDGNIILQPGSSTGFVYTVLTGPDYAARCVGNVEAIINEQRLQDVVGALTTTNIPEGTNLYYTQVRRDAQTLGDHSGVTILSATTGDNLVFISPDWVNRAPVDGQIKANTFDTNLTTGAQLTFTGLTTEVDVVYRITGETTTALNLSSFPTTSIPLNYGGAFQALGTVGVDGDFYRLGATAADDRWIQNPVPGQISEYRIEGSYSNKTVSNSGRIQIRIYNPLTAFSFEASVPLAQGLTADEFGVSLITISDGANLLPPAGTGGGYKIGISSTTSVDVVIQSIVRIDRYRSYRS